jgi:hypothetical protein
MKDGKDFAWRFAAVGVDMSLVSFLLFLLCLVVVVLMLEVRADAGMLLVDGGVCELFCRFAICSVVCEGGATDVDVDRCCFCVGSTVRDFRLLHRLLGDGGNSGLGATLGDGLGESCARFAGGWLRLV